MRWWNKATAASLKEKKKKQTETKTNHLRRVSVIALQLRAFVYCVEPGFKTQNNNNNNKITPRQMVWEMNTKAQLVVCAHDPSMQRQFKVRAALGYIVAKSEVSPGYPSLFPKQRGRKRGERKAHGCASSPQR